MQGEGTTSESAAAATERDFRILLQVRGLTGNVTEEHLRELMTRFGEIKKIDGKVQNALYEFVGGAAWVEFTKDESAVEALSHFSNKPVLDGAPLTTQLVKRKIPSSKPSPKKEPTPVKKEPEKAVSEDDRERRYRARDSGRDRDRGYTERSRYGRDRRESPRYERRYGRDREGDRDRYSGVRDKKPAPSRWHRGARSESLPKEARLRSASTSTDSSSSSSSSSSTSSS